MNAFLIYLTPVVACFFFFILIGIFRDILDGEKEITVKILLGGGMFAFIVFALIVSGISN